MNRNRPIRVFSSQLGVIVYTLLLRVLTCRVELQLSGLGDRPQRVPTVSSCHFSAGWFHMTDFHIRFCAQFYSEKN